MTRQEENELILLGLKYIPIMLMLLVGLGFLMVGVFSGSNADQMDTK